MPIYEYECSACGSRFERLQRFADPAIDICPQCGERRVQRLVSSPAIQFKGSGWYVTDYARKSGAGTEGKPAASSDAKDGKSTAEPKDATGSSSETKSASGSSGSTDTTKPTS